MNTDLGARNGSRAGVARCALWLGLAVLAGCSSPPPIKFPVPPPPKPPTVVVATVEASANVNPDVRKRASPIVIRIFELKSSASFDGADFISLYERDQATLAAEMGAREEFVLRPGETKLWEKIPGDDVRFIGVIAAFRDIESARWKAKVPVKANVRNLITIRADGITLTGTAAAQ